MNAANGWISLLGQNVRPLVVGTAAENDRVLCRDESGKVGVHRVVPVGEETIWLLGNAVEGQELVDDDLPHAQAQTAESKNSAPPVSGGAP